MTTYINNKYAIFSDNPRFICLKLKLMVADIGLYGGVVTIDVKLKSFN